MISVAKLRAAVPAAADVDEVLLRDMIARAVDFVQSQTHRYFGPISEVTEYLSGRGSRQLWLPDVAIPDDDGALVLVEERPYPGADATEIAAEGYRLVQGPRASHLLRLGGTVWGRGLEYAVTYERGFDVDTGPGDIEQLIIDLVEDRLDLNGEEELQSETIGGYSYTRFRPADVALIDGGQATLSAWRRPVFA